MSSSDRAERDRQGGSRGGGGASKEKEKQKSSSKDSKSGKTAAKPSAAEIRAEEYQEFIRASVGSHAAWLSTPLLNISASLGISPLHLSLILLSLFTLLLLLSPTSWIPHISTPIVILIPLQNTFQCLAQEKRKSKSAGPTDLPQWMIFWIGWVLLGWAGEWVRVFRPGWRGVWEIGKVGAGVVLGGPWFGRAALRISERDQGLKMKITAKPSSRLVEAEKREAAEAAKAEKAATDKKKEEERKAAKEHERAREQAKCEAKKREQAKKQVGGST